MIWTSNSIFFKGIGTEISAEKSSDLVNFILHPVFYGPTPLILTKFTKKKELSYTAAASLHPYVHINLFVKSQVSLS